MMKTRGRALLVFLLCASLEWRGSFRAASGSLRQGVPCAYGQEDEKILPSALVSVSKETGNKFIVIIDEWDALFREVKNDDALQKKYVFHSRDDVLTLS